MDAKGQRIEGVISGTDQLAYYRGAVEGYLLEAIPILDRDDIDLSKDYLEEVELGTVRFEPPAELVAYAKNNIEHLAPGAEIPTPTEQRLVGLRSLLKANSPLRQEFGVAMVRNGDTEQMEQTVAAEIPQYVLDRAVETTDKALAEADIGIELEEEEQRTKITWELIQEVDQWRRENIPNKE
jgi:hypothetical protein